MGPTTTLETDVLVIGAGPGGSAAAYHLARHGIDVTVVDRSAFPREKACGDGLTPRSVRSIQRMGIDVDDPGFQKVIGLRVYSRRVTMEFRWPDLDRFPGFGLVMPRSAFDELLVRRAEKAGARLLERTEAVSPLLRDDWVIGARVRRLEEGADAQEAEIRSRFVLAADGASSRFGAQVGVRRDPTRPLGIAARRYCRVAHDPGPWMESWLDLWEGEKLLPGYGWLFPLADGSVNLGAGLLNTFEGFKEVSARRLYAAFERMLPPSWRVSGESAGGDVLSGPLPMGGNRRPVSVPGMLLIGDAAGVVNPFNGEGIAYAVETGEMAAELTADALVRNRPGLAHMYPSVLRQRYGPYFTLGRTFARLIGDPLVMRTCTRYLLPRASAMRLAMRLMANLTDGRDGDAQDRLIYALERLAPAS